MSRPASQLERLIARTRRRLLVADAVRLGGLWLTVSVAVAVLLTLVDRFTAIELPWWLLALVALSGAPLACAIAWRRRAAALDAAVLLDKDLRLKDRLGTAIAVQSITSIDHDNPMTRWVYEDALQVAARIDPRAAARINWPMSWGTALLGAVGCALLLWLVEPRDVFARPAPTAGQIAALDARQRAAESLRQRAEQLRANDQNDPQATEQADSAARQQALATLDRLAQQLDAPSGNASGGTISAPSRTSDAELSSAAREAIELADRLDREAQIEREAQRRAAKRLADLEPPTAPGAADAFAKSLKDGDIAAATKWLESLEERLNSAPPEEQKALADSLRQTAEQISKSAQPEDASESTTSKDRSLEDLGLTPEQIEEWQQQTPPLDAIRRELQDQRHDPIDAQQLAEQVQRDLAERAAEEKSRRQLEETARRVSELADTIDQPPPAEQPAEAPKTEPDSGPKTQPDSPRDPSAATPSEPTSKEGERSTDGSGQGGDASAQQEAPDAGSKPGAGEKPQPGDKPGQSGAQREPSKEGSQQQQTTKPGETDTPKKAVKPGDDTKPGDTTKPGAAPTPGEAGKPVEGTRPQPGEKPTEAPKAEPGGKESTDPAAEPKPRDGGKPQAEGTPQPGEQGEPTATEGASPRPEPGSGAEPPQPEPGQGKPEPGAAPSPGESPEGQTPGTRVTPSADATGEPSSSESDAPASVADRVKRLRDTLDQIDQSKDGGAPPNQEISQEMREAAKELLEQMSPEERRELEQWAAEKARENASERAGGSDGSPKSLLDRTLPTQAVANPRLFEYDTQDVNLSKPDKPANDRVIAEMYGPDQDRPQGAIDRQPMNIEQIREAAQAIERALSEEAIPVRYRPLISRWARRIPNAAESSSPPAEAPKP